MGLLDNADMVDAKKFEILDSNGKLKEIPFTKDGDTYILEKSAQILDPVVIFVS